MAIERFSFAMETYDSIGDLEQKDASLLAEARSTTQFSYAPYSNFNVGAFAKLINGETVSGTNQENASYPAGICAERTLLSAAASLYPGVAIETIAISYKNLNGKSNHPISPCGICRQSLVEFQNRTGSPIRLILGGMEGKVIIIHDAAHLMPLLFSAKDMVTDKG